MVLCKDLDLLENGSIVKKYYARMCNEWTSCTCTYYAYVDDRHKYNNLGTYVIEKTIILILLPHEVVYLFDTVVVDDIEYKKMVWPDGITLTTLIF